MSQQTDVVENIRRFTDDDLRNASKLLDGLDVDVEAAVACVRSTAAMRELVGVSPAGDPI